MNAIHLTLFLVCISYGACAPTPNDGYGSGGNYGYDGQYANYLNDDYDPEYAEEASNTIIENSSTQVTGDGSGNVGGVNGVTNSEINAVNNQRGDRTTSISSSGDVQNTETSNMSSSTNVNGGAETTATGAGDTTTVDEVQEAANACNSC